jgi:hypothetical protein
VDGWTPGGWGMGSVVSGGDERSALATELRVLDLLRGQGLLSVRGEVRRVVVLALLGLAEGGAV